MAQFLSVITKESTQILLIHTVSLVESRGKDCWLRWQIRDYDCGAGEEWSELDCQSEWIQDSMGCFMFQTQLWSCSGRMKDFKLEKTALRLLSKAL